MKAQDIFKGRIYSGEIAMPGDSHELCLLLESYAKAIEFKGDFYSAVEDYKESIIVAHKYKSLECGGAYITALRQAKKSNNHKALNEATESLFGIDLMIYSIQRLVVEGRVKVIGKKVYLIN